LLDEQLDDLSLAWLSLFSNQKGQANSASVLLTATSEHLKKPICSSNRGRTTGVSHSKYRVGKIWSAKSPPSKSNKVALAFRERIIAGKLGAITEAIDFSWRSLNGAGDTACFFILRQIGTRLHYSNVR